MDQVIERFLGGDPIAGTQALQELVALGDKGEDALFSRAIEFPRTAQARRRWLRYVASRKASIAGRLLDRMQNQAQFGDAYAAAYLFAGLSNDRAVTDVLYRQIDPDLGDHGAASNRFMAWGYVGGDAATLWHLVRGDSYTWEKLRTFGFRASCAACARVSAGDDWAIEQLITHEWRDYEFTEIKNSPDASISHQAVDSAELWMQANDPFVVWRRGEVADVILRDWSRHAHWRVRDFGAQILASLGFQRTVTPVVEWLRREQIERVRKSLLHSLERSDTATGADVLIEHFESSGQEGRAYVAKAAWRASDKNRALAALNVIVNGDDSAAAEALVSLARLGHRDAYLVAALDSQDDYRRLNAALAFAYLGDQSAVKQLTAMQDEAATSIERVYLAAALAILGKPNGAAELNRELVAAASERDFDKRLDILFLHRCLQMAILDGLEAGKPQGDELLTAWRAELQPFDPVPKPVIAATPAKAAPALAPQFPTADTSPSAQAAAAGPLNVFMSYSHRDEKMRVKLGQHMAQLVNDELIRIWQDREIEAALTGRG